MQLGVGESGSRFELEPIEKASVDELRALQWDRLRVILRRAFDNCLPYR
jgi:phenylacetate-CoA ligase